MPRYLSDRLRVGFLAVLLLGAGGEVVSQSELPESTRQYEDIVMEVLEVRLQQDVQIDGTAVRLTTSPSRLLKAMRNVVRASVPYYFEGAMAQFRKFRPRVADALADLNGWEVPPAPRGWETADWAYYQVESRIQDVLLLVAMDVGVFADRNLAQGVRARSGLSSDWEDLRGGRDPLQTDPLPELGAGAVDGSTLDGLGGPAGGTNPTGDPALAELTEAIRSLIDRVDALERGRPSVASGGVPDGGSFPSRGVDGGWVPSRMPGGSASLPEGLPETFTLAFPTGGAGLSLSAEYGLNTLIEWMAAYPGLRVLVTGHSDATGGDRANMALSRRRAQVVRWYLLEHGVSPDRVTAAHFGEQRPEWGGAFDRRVEVRLLFD
ncbi:MAG: OmpA family protein [Crocinitomicaceae bacterium TMED114]|nr:MAG: OmpA family protein [Crocinitomicaceae bacterium TMED114]